MAHDSVEIWGLYQDLHDAFQTRSFTATMASEAVGCSKEDLNSLFESDLVYKDGDKFSLAHAEKFEELIEELRAGDKS